MSAILHVFRRFMVMSGANVLLDWGSIAFPQKETTIDATTVARPKTVTMAAGTSRKIWDYEDDGEFSLFFIECDGYGWVAQKVDKPTDAAADPPDYSQSGLAVNYPKEGVSCFAPFIIQGIAVPVVPTAGGHQDNYAGSAFHATTVDGRRYEIWLKVPADAESDVTFSYGWA